MEFEENEILRKLLNDHPDLKRTIDGSKQTDGKLFENFAVTAMVVSNVCLNVLKAKGIITEEESADLVSEMSQMIMEEFGLDIHQEE
jgi:ribosomal protein S19E (S16A)